MWQSVIVADQHYLRTCLFFADVELQIPDMAPYFNCDTSGVRAAFYAVFDGHAGKNAAEFCAESISPLLWLAVISTSCPPCALNVQ